MIHQLRHKHKHEKNFSQRSRTQQMGINAFLKIHFLCTYIYHIQLQCLLQFLLFTDFVRVLNKYSTKLKINYFFQHILVCLGQSHDNSSVSQTLNNVNKGYFEKKNLCVVELCFIVVLFQSCSTHFLKI